jgi:hypothetical protein
VRSRILCGMPNNDVKLPNPAQLSHELKDTATNGV